MDRHFLNGLGNGGPVVTEQQEKQQEQQRVNFVSGQIREQIETNRQLLEAAHRETRAV